MAKNKVMKSQGTAEDVELFAPVKKEAERLGVYILHLLPWDGYSYQATKMA